LVDFTFADPFCGVRDKAAWDGRIAGVCEFVGVREEPVSDKDACGDIPAYVNGGLMTAKFSHIEDIVVDEGGGVNEFDDHREPDRFIGARAEEFSSEEG
jgi:hypothetical protein